MTTLALGWWLLGILVAVNAWWSRGNEKRARELDEFAEELLRDRASVMKAAREVASDRESLSVFVAINPLARLKAPSPEA